MGLAGFAAAVDCAVRNNGLERRRVLRARVNLLAAFKSCGGNLLQVLEREAVFAV
jgi:hypothetical protein